MPCRTGARATAGSLTTPTTACASTAGGENSAGSRSMRPRWRAWRLCARCWKKTAGWNRRNCPDNCPGASTRRRCARRQPAPLRSTAAARRAVSTPRPCAPCSPSSTVPWPRRWPCWGSSWAVRASRSPTAPTGWRRFSPHWAARRWNARSRWMTWAAPMRRSPCRAPGSARRSWQRWPARWGASAAARWKRRRCCPARA